MLNHILTTPESEVLYEKMEAHQKAACAYYELRAKLNKLRTIENDELENLKAIEDEHHNQVWIYKNKLQAELEKEMLSKAA